MKLERLWEESASAWIASMGESGDISRRAILDGPMLRLAGPVAGLRVCDVGCGEGRFSRMLDARGASMLGIEPTPTLLATAKSRDPHGYYVAGVGEAIPLRDEAFDLVISYLVLVDIADYAFAISEMVRILRPGGRLLVANMNSFATTRDNPWIRDKNGRRLHMAVEDYFRERADIVSWSNIRIVNYHRPFEAYMKSFLGAGLILTNFEEPDIDSGLAANDADWPRVPLFHVMLWRKPGSG